MTIEWAIVVSVALVCFSAIISISDILTQLRAAFTEWMEWMDEGLYGNNEDEDDDDPDDGQQQQEQR